MKRKLFAVLAAGMMMMSVAGPASAAPNERANCTAGEAQEEDNTPGISEFARQREGGRSLVGDASSSNCGDRGGEGRR